MGKKKEKTVEEIISDYQKHHHKKGKSFKERIKKFEEFHDPENIHALQLSHHAHYTIFGKPTDQKGFPGAYNEAYKILDKHVSNDADKLDDSNKLTDILEMYVDTFLQKAMGDKFKTTMKKAEGKKLSKKDIRELKGQLMGKYHTDEEGNPVNILSEAYINRLKGKKKIELIEELKGLSKTIQESYSRHLQGEALEGVISEDDRFDMADYIEPIFKKKGLTHKKHHLLRSAREQAMHYGLLLQGASETLVKKAGYKPFKEKESKE